MKKYFFLAMSGLLYWLIEIGLVQFIVFLHLGDRFEMFLIVFFMPLVFGIVVLSILDERRFIAVTLLTISIVVYITIFLVQVFLSTPKELNTRVTISRIFFLRAFL